MRPHRATAFFAALAMLLAHAASAQVTDGKDDASQQGPEDARVPKVGGAAKD